MKEYVIEILQIARVTKKVLALDIVAAMKEADEQAEGDFQDGGNATYEFYKGILSEREVF